MALLWRKFWPVSFKPSGHTVIVNNNKAGAPKRKKIMFLPRYGAILDPDHSSDSELLFSRLPWTYFWSCPSVKVWSSKKSISCGCQSEEIRDLDEIVQDLHSLLDKLPSNGPSEYLLDIVVNRVPTLSPGLYGVLKRCSTWHNAKIVLVAPNDQYLGLDDIDFVALDSFVKVQAVLKSNLVWRGSLEFQRGSGVAATLDGLELTGHPVESTRQPNMLCSTQLQVVSPCALSSMPAYLLTSHRLRLETRSGNAILKDLFANDAFFGKVNGLIVKLDYYCGIGDVNFMEKKKNPRTSEGWKQFVLTKRDNNAATNPGQALENKNVQSIFFLVANDGGDDDDGHKVAIKLDPSQGFERKRHDVLSPRPLLSKEGSPPPIQVLDVQYDVHRLKLVIGQVQEAVMATLERTNPQSQWLRPENRTEGLRAIRNRILDHLQRTSSSSGDKIIIKDFSVQDCIASDLPDNGLESEEKRFLSRIGRRVRDELSKREEDRGQEDKTMKPSGGDYVVLEAKEMLKLFDSHALAKMEGTELSFKRKQATASADDAAEDDLKNQDAWPTILLADYHDLYYNKGERSEQQDREMAKIQQLYVGSRETHSTCHGLNTNNSSIVQVTKTKKQQADNDTVAPSSRPRFAASVIRKSPRKRYSKNVSDNNTAQSGAAAPADNASKAGQSKSRAPEDVYKQKLRGAVYDALSSKGVTEDDPVFRPSFKKLFEICKMYAKDLVPSNVNSTKKFLGQVAQQNVDIVINLEKSILLRS